MEVVILDSGYKSYDFERKLFEGSGFRLKIHPDYKGNPSEKREYAKNAHGILVRHTIIDEAFLAEMKNLKALVRYGVGYDNIDVEACSRHGVRVANVQGYANNSVSDHALALMLACARAMWNPEDQLMKGFGAPPVPDVFELHDKVLGIIGLGRIGSTLCRKAAPLFSKIVACDPYKPEEHFRQLQVMRVTLDELLESSDLISLHCNLNTETRHLIDHDKFRQMKKKPVVVNTSRGEVIDEAALLHALDSGLIHSAGIDVYENEPLTDRQSAIAGHSRTICTGHYAWYSDSASEELQHRAALNLLDFLTEKPVEDALN